VPSHAGRRSRISRCRRRVASFIVESVPTSCGRQHGEDDALGDRSREVSERPRILIEPNAHHLLNLGDVAMLQVAVGRLHSLWPGASISVITDDPVRLAGCCPGTLPVPAAGRRLWFDSNPFTYTLQQMAPRPVSLRLRESERFLRRRTPGAARRLVRARAALGRKDARPLDEFLQAVHDADIFISSGAGAFNDEFASLAISILDLLQMAREAGAFTAALGHGIGPITEPVLLRRAREVLPNVDLVTLRERVGGQPLLASFGVPSDRVLVTGDDAVELAHGAHREGAAGHLGFNLRMARYAHVDQRAADSVGATVREAALRHRCRLLSIPISYHPNEVDGVVNATLLGASDDAAGEVETALQAVELIGRCRAVVTGSYHAAVFALAQGIPAVGLTGSAYYDAKFVGLADQFDGSGLWIVGLDHADLPARLASAVDEAWEYADAVRPALLERAARQVESGRAAYRRLRELVASRAESS
jgi:polysaccharide pyruvyl transferase WcaK-like protein